MVNFHLKVDQIWGLSSKIQGFEILSLALAKASNFFLIDIENGIDLIVYFFKEIDWCPR